MRLESLAGEYTTTLMLALIGALLSVPLQLYLSKRIGRKRTLTGLLALLSTIFLLSTFFPFYAMRTVIYPVGICLGVCLTLPNVVPDAILGDIIDYDELRTGARSEAMCKPHATQGSSPRLAGEVVRDLSPRLAGEVVRDLSRRPCRGGGAPEDRCSGRSACSLPLGLALPCLALDRHHDRDQHTARGRATAHRRAALHGPHRILGSRGLRVRLRRQLQGRGLRPCALGLPGQRRVHLRRPRRQPRRRAALR